MCNEASQARIFQLYLWKCPKSIIFLQAIFLKLKSNLCADELMKFFEFLAKLYVPQAIVLKLNSRGKTSSCEHHNSYEPSKRKN